MLIKSMLLGLTLICSSAMAAVPNLNVVTSVKVLDQKSASQVLQKLVSVMYGGEDLPELRARLELKLDSKTDITYGKLVSLNELKGSDQLNLAFQCEAVIVSNAKVEVTFSKEVKKQLGPGSDTTTETVIDANCDTTASDSEKVFLHLVKSSNGVFSGLIQVGDEYDKTAKYYQVFGDFKK